MRMRLLRGVSAILVTMVCVACSPNATPDQIRQKTAEGTAALKRDSKAVAEGIKDGLSNKRAVDLNHASKAELSDLPGITDKQADHIIAERPYANTHQLVSRHVLTEDEYAKIQSRVVVNR
jgi:DNA uptake protein ComE-like DNA-binding protein